MSQIAVIGAGAWGTALSIVLGRSERHHIRLWAYEKEVRDAIESTRTNTVFLPEHRIPNCVSATGDFRVALSGAEIIVSALPSQHCRRVFQEMVAHISPDVLVASATKGLEQNTLLRMSEVICEVMKEKCRIGSLSGPTFAQEVARGDPTPPD